MILDSYFDFFFLFQVRDGNALTELEDYLVPHLHSEPLHRDLLRQLLVSMNAKCDTS